MILVYHLAVLIFKYYSDFYVGVFDIYYSIYTFLCWLSRVHTKLPQI